MIPFYVMLTHYGNQALKILQIINRSCHAEVFFGKDVLKICTWPHMSYFKGKIKRPVTFRL